MEYFIPLSKRFFVRGRTLEESILDHVELVLRTPLGGWLADTRVGLDIPNGQHLANAGEVIASSAEAAIVYAEPRVQRAEITAVQLSPGFVRLAIELAIVDRGREVRSVKANASLWSDPFRVSLERG